MSFAKELQFALEVVQKCCEITKAVAASSLSEQTLTKDDRSPVTVGDFSVQALVNHRISQVFPEDQIVAEEDTKKLTPEILEKVVHHVNVCAQLPKEEVLKAIDRGCAAGGPKGRFWVLDPIDGTEGFLKRKQYAVCLALMIDGDIKVGVLGCPNFEGGMILGAEKGCGACRYTLQLTEKTPIQVTPTADSSAMQACESDNASHTDQARLKRINESLGVTKEPLLLDSQAKYAAVASGKCDAYLRLPLNRKYQERIWDHAAGFLIVREAGGNVCDIQGLPLDFTAGRTLKNNLGIVCTNGALHAKVVEAVKTQYADF